jgi:four helix bundle protein
MARFKNLIVYQKSKDLVMQVYALLKQFPDDERFALCGQIRRAAISIPSNIAEGMARMSNKDQSHFLNIAYGSLMELYAQLDIAHDLGYINQNEYDKIEISINEIDKMIVSLSYIRKQNTVSNGNNK